MKGKNPTIFEWGTKTPYANTFAFRGNFVSKVYGKGYHQLIAKDHLSKGSTTIKATIKKYGDNGWWIAFGLLTQSKRN